MNNLKHYIDMAVRREIRRSFRDASVSGTANAVIRNIDKLYESLPDERKKDTGLVLKKAALLIKKVPALHSRDKVNGTDKAYDACNDALDMLNNVNMLYALSRIGSPTIDDLVSLVN